METRAENKGLGQRPRCAHSASQLRATGDFASEAAMVNTMAWQADQIGLEYQIMATLGCSAAERLLRAYLRAIRDSNKAHGDYLRALEEGNRALVRAKAYEARDSTDCLRAAREAFEMHRRKHRC